jgi:hypothetical protein
MCSAGRAVGSGWELACGLGAAGAPGVGDGALERAVGHDAPQVDAQRNQRLCDLRPDAGQDGLGAQQSQRPRGRDERACNIGIHIAQAGNIHDHDFASCFWGRASRIRVAIWVIAPLGERKGTSTWVIGMTSPLLLSSSASPDQVPSLTA